ncbi:uncharacterized protein Z519_08956 [Cladophialophora bantiana CBS 173.52]|uniref:FAD-binding domain-containing protein n=1 Tax=Cladophialophora bantiana (strain ATCC 10958 / CBS 173.52 / CDC B-1940 / NIH 8579) TaxID=1442370 RepID=A0A0D2FUT8_CLAB1|nr:uncharacterized protein Z519_08956 [Cladophialophora bantiana CBS 173.52]KIW90312.1 hypothetical protein Z519_08956 [Cladophialophora bantiana CBS 173.52]
MCEESSELEGFAANSTNLELDSTWQNGWLSNLDSTSTLITNRDPALHFQFLIRFAKNRGLADTFEIGKFAPAARQSICGRQNVKARDDGLGLSKGQAASEASSTELSQLSQDRTLVIPFSTGDANPRTLCNGSLLMKTMEICNGLKTTLMNKSVGSALSMEWSPLTKAMAQQFFGPSNLRAFMQRYWTFLSSHSYDRGNATSGSTWLRSGYSTIHTCRRRRPAGTISISSRRTKSERFKLFNPPMRFSSTNIGRVENLRRQGSAEFDLMCWSGSRKTLAPAKHNMHRSPVMDTGLTTWHNTPAKLVLRELVMAPACPELCFQAELAAECADKLNAWRSCFPYRPAETMYSVIRVFCKAKLPDDTKLGLPYCSLLSLWAVVKAFYTMVFTLGTTIGPEAHMQPILNGIESWKIVWNRRLNNGDDDALDVPLPDNVAGTIRSSARPGWATHRILPPAHGFLDKGFTRRRCPCTDGRLRFILEVYRCSTKLSFLNRFFRWALLGVMGQTLTAPFHGTFFDYFLNIRLKYSESIIQAAYQRGGGNLLIGWEFRDLKPSVSKDGTCRVTVQVAHVDAPATDELKCAKKLIQAQQISCGCRWGNSLVRRLSGISFPQDATAYNWVRIDGVVKTNGPDSRIGVAGTESVSHGNVLWVLLDHCRTRIGFALNKEMYEKYDDKITEEQAKHKATQAVLPFTLEFESVDWYTIYSIRQGVAEQYMINDCVLLAGDASHTHSSGAAQVMNTGIHDAINLSWKLEGVLSGWFKPEILQTYDSERRQIARTLIEHDKQYSTLISGDKIDKVFEGDVNQLLANLIRNTADFVLGLGISYEENIINLSPNAVFLSAGHLPDDALLYGPGRSVPVRLQQEIPRLQDQDSKLCGDTCILRVLSGTLNKRGVVKYMTIINGCKPQGEEAIGMASFGLIYYDDHAIVQEKFGFTESEGGTAVLRPDGHLGFATSLDRGSEVDAYFRQFVVDQSQLAPLSKS